MEDFEKLSLEPGLIVNPETGEQKIIIIKQRIKSHVGTYISPKYSQESIDLARLVTSKLGENVICKLLGGKKAKRKNNKGSDIILPGGIRLEAKVGRIGNSAVIKKNQLEFLDKNGLFGIMYFRTNGNEPPSFFTSLDNGIKPEIYLTRNIKIDSLYIFPRGLMVYFYNTSKLNEGVISTTGINHKPLCITNAKKLIELAKERFQIYEKIMIYNGKEIKIFSVGYEL